MFDYGDIGDKNTLFSVAFYEISQYCSNIESSCTRPLIPVECSNICIILFVINYCCYVCHQFLYIFSTISAVLIALSLLFLFSLNCFHSLCFWWSLMLVTAVLVSVPNVLLLDISMIAPEN